MCKDGQIVAPSGGVRLDCEDSYSALADGLATLRLIWDHVANGSFEDSDKLERALNTTLHPMEAAITDLGRKLGLERAESEGSEHV